MPYSANEVPAGTSGLPDAARNVFIKAFNAAYKEHGEESAFKIAWAAVKAAGYHKNEDGKWVKKMLYNSIGEIPEQVQKLTPDYQEFWYAAYKFAADLGRDDIIASRAAWLTLQEIATTPTAEFSLYIAKASLDENGKMRFLATASDTKEDVFKERMSLELFEGFIDDFTGEEFVSLSHYPRLKSKRGELGAVEKIYLDGDYLKVGGYFHETTLGKAAYNAIRKDRRDNVPFEKRNRVSIGFYDRKHKHDDLVWEFGKGPCIYCMSGLGNKVYLKGKLDHVAITRSPANKRTNIEAK